jgi:hypothetical protein
LSTSTAETTGVFSFSEPAGSVLLPPSLNWLACMVTFQPAPDPRASMTRQSLKLVVRVWVEPVRAVAAKSSAVGLVLNDSVPPLSVTDVVSVAALAAVDVTASTTALATAAATTFPVCAICAFLLELLALAHIQVSAQIPDVPSSYFGGFVPDLRYMDKSPNGIASAPCSAS